MSENPAAAFSEKDFYLNEFRGWTLAFAVPVPSASCGESLLRVLDELAGVGARGVVLASDAAWLEDIAGRCVGASAARLEGLVWRSLRDGARLGIVLEGPFAPAVRDVALRLRVPKLVWIDAAGGLCDETGRRLSFVDLEELRAWLRDKPGADASQRAPLLEEVRALLEGGIRAVNVCTAEGLADELFTYAGSGTLFTRERYIDVHRLGVDDFDAAQNLIRRGVEEGYLAPRSPEEVEDVLASAFGAFVEGSHLAGIAALRVHDADQAGEIASVYTLTRFLGEGVGGHLVSFAVEQARAMGLMKVFACTTSERVGAFFERNGFRRADASEIPDAKWQSYDPARRERLLCFVHSLD